MGLFLAITIFLQLPLQSYDVQLEIKMKPIQLNMNQPIRH